MKKFRQAAAQLRSMDNVEYVLRDSQGNIKQLFQEKTFAKEAHERMKEMKRPWLRAVNE